jgi:restriction endonuclease Mrr
MITGKNQPPRHPRECLNCGQALSEEEDSLPSKSSEELGWGYHIHVRYRMWCPNCQWWCIFVRDKEVDHASQNLLERIDVYEGIIKRFNVSQADIPLGFLRAYLEKHPDKIHSVNTHTFEHLVGDVYKDFYDCEVKHVGGPGDNGIDLIAIISDEPHVIQTKRREHTGHIEGVAIVREFIGALIAADINKGFVVTTAQDFSIPAKRLAQHERLQRYGIEITLMPLPKLLAIMKATRVKVPQIWETLNPT